MKRTWKSIASLLSPGPGRDLFERVAALWKELHQKVLVANERSLPLAEFFVDRVEKSKSLGFGEGTTIYDSALVLGDVKVGRQVWIGPNTILDGTGGLTIGSFCSIAAGVQIYSHSTVNWALSAGEEPYEYAATAIGDRCYIGPYSIISKGVTIGDGCVIGAHSLVLESIPAGMKAYGSPCRVMGPAKER